MRPYFILLFMLVAFSNALIARNAPSTYFNIYLSPNKNAIQLNVPFIMTAIVDQTTFTITDDNIVINPDSGYLDNDNGENKDKFKVYLMTHNLDAFINSADRKFIF